MKRLKHSQIAHLDSLLERRALELRDEIRQALLRSDQQHHRDLAGLVGDAGDESVANLLADIDAAIVDRHVNELRTVEAARVRMKAGCYGMCADCGDTIAYERLAAYPTATRCARCAPQHERTHVHEGTPTI